MYFLTFTTLWANLTADTLLIFFLFFLENSIWHFMQIVSTGDKVCFLGKMKKKKKKKKTEDQWS